MMESLITRQICVDEAGNRHQFEYRLITGRIFHQGRRIPDYGVCITSPEAEPVRIPSITTDRARMEELMALLIKNCVTPTSLPYIIEDWL